VGCPRGQSCHHNHHNHPGTGTGPNPCFPKSVSQSVSQFLTPRRSRPVSNLTLTLISSFSSCPSSIVGSRGSALIPLLSPLSVAQGNDTTRLHYDLRTISVNVRLSARDPITERAPERYLPTSDVQYLMHKEAFHPPLSVRAHPVDSRGMRLTCLAF
jgi:hypothetical protein